MTKISNRTIFIWNLLGSLSTAAISVLLLFVVARFLGDQEADLFSFSYSLGHLFVIIGLFQVRNFQSTDIQQRYSFKTYFLFRCITCFLMILSLIMYISLNQYTHYKIEVIIYVVLLRVIDSFSDVFQGHFQQHGRLDIAGKSLFFRNICVFLTFTIMVKLTNNLLPSLIISLISSVISTLFLDIYNLRIISTEKKKSQSIFQLIRETFPLFLTGFLLAFVYNQPKYALDYLMEQGQGEIGLQKDFNILFLPVFVMNLMMLFLRPQVTKLAHLESQGKIIEFKKLTRQIIVVLFTLSILFFVGSYVVGLPIMGLVFGTDLTSYKYEFMILIIGGILSSFATLFDNLLTVIRQQRKLIIPYGISFIVSVLLTSSMVLSYGIKGAAYSFLITMFVWSILILLIYYYEEQKL